MHKRTLVYMTSPMLVETALLLVVKETRPVHHSRNEMVALARLDDPFLPHNAAYSTKSARPPSSMYSDSIYIRDPFVTIATLKSIFS